MKKFLASFLFTLCFCTFNFSQEKPQGIGSGSGVGTGQPARKSDTTGIVILSKPRPAYTDIARKNDIEGVVRLKVTFLASGEVGSITPVTTLPYGLTEQAIAAAKGIRFQPAKVNGQPISVSKMIEYSFSFYYDENDKSLKEKAKIVNLPLPEHPSEENLKKLGGKVILVVLLKSSGEVSIEKISTNLPKEFELKAKEAASKITFKPAVSTKGNQVSQIKTINYEFKSQKK